MRTHGQAWLRRPPEQGLYRRPVPSGFAGAESGSALIQFAVAMPVLILLICGMLAFGEAMYVRNALQHAVDMAARCASVDTKNCSTAAAVTAYAARQQFAFVAPTSADFSLTSSSCGNQVSGS